MHSHFAPSRRTPKNPLPKPVLAQKKKDFSAETIARMEQEMVTLERDLQAAGTGYGKNGLNSALLRACVRQL